MNHLNPASYGMRLSPYFSFKNHAKIIMTDNMIYWGSSNFSDESFANLECGTISTGKELIEFVRDTLFSEIQRESVPYFKYNFAVAIANLESLIPACERARQHLFDATFEPWSDYDTNFEEKWIYRTTNCGLTDKFLQKFIDFFSSFDDALNVIADIINEYCELDELPEQVETLSVLFEEYKNTFEAFYDNISTLFEDLKLAAKYDASAEACKIISDKYSMEAYDENLDYYVEKAENETMTFYEELITASEHTVRETLECLDSMIQYLERLNETLHELLEVNPKIDNTDVQ